MDALMNNEVHEARLDMMEKEGIGTYIFKLHKSALNEQLSCFLKEAGENKE